MMQWVASLLLAGLVVGCGEDDVTISGRALDPCLQSIPACPGLFAACVLDESRYAEATLPGSFRFLVDAQVDDTIEVLIYLVEPRDAGRSTQIFWNEPGCSDVYTYDSAGRNLFLEAEDSGVIAEGQTVLESGEHLIEIFSDMQADVLITVNVIISGTR